MDVECVVIGAGVVGLAIARELALAKRDVIVIEAESCFGSHTSSRNSEVIHAGLYYPENSLKARFCVAGKHELYQYIETRGLPNARCGKLIVAADDSQSIQLEKLKAQGEINGVDDLVILDHDQALSREASLACTSAMLSPSTGIIDSHSLMNAFLGDLNDAGGFLSLNTEVTNILVSDRGHEVRTRDRSSGEKFELNCKWLINSAGLYATEVAGRMENFPQEHVPPLAYARGNYFSFNGKSPFSSLIYPLPEPGGLGVHLTLDLMGQARFGPDVEWVDEIGYEVDPSRCAGFYESVRTYWPELPDNSLVPAYSGIRPKLPTEAGKAADFRIDTQRDHGAPGIINLFGIESPGLTSSMAIARHVNDCMTDIDN